MGIQRVTGGYKGHRGLQGFTGGYKGFQGVKGGYKGLQRVTDELFSNYNVPRGFFLVILHNSQSGINIKFFDENDGLTPFEKGEFCVVHKQMF